MGILDAIKAQVAGAVGGAPAQGGGVGNPLVSHVLQMISNPGTGGLQGIVQAFQAKGLGGIVESWVSTGPNQPIAPDQINHALGDHVQQMAQASGMPANAVATQLSALLPDIINRLTPQGTVPQGGALAQGLSILEKALGAHAAPTQTPPTR